MFCATRNGVSAKEVQRRIGCTYKTAWGARHEIENDLASRWRRLAWRLQQIRAGDVERGFAGERDKRGEDGKTAVSGGIGRRRPEQRRARGDRARFRTCGETPYARRRQRD